MRFARFALKLQRFELIAAVILALLVAILGVYVAAQLDASGVSQECYRRWFHGEVGPVGPDPCFLAITPFLQLDQSLGAQVLSAIGLVPIVLGGMLGVTAVARELEAGTAAFVWAAAASRRRWLIMRTLPIMVVLVALAGVLSASGAVLAGARQPWAPSLAGFAGVTIDPPNMMLLALASYWIALLLGLAVARTLPAIILSAVVLPFLWIVPTTVRSVWAYDEATHHVRSTPFNDFDDPGGIAYGTMSQLRDGTLIRDEDADNFAPIGTDPMIWLTENATEVFVGVPGDKARTWLVMYRSGLAIVLIGSITATAIGIERRRPTGAFT